MLLKDEIMNMYKKQDLLEGATIAIRDCMGYRNGEALLIITDTKWQHIGKVFLEAAHRLEANVEYAVMRPTGGDGKEPSKQIADIMKRFDVILLPTYYSLSHTKARINASRIGTRIASMPRISEYTLAKGAMRADYKKVKRLTERIHRQVRKANKIRITSPDGTDLAMEFGDYVWQKDTGIFHKKGDFGNLPAGEVDTAPNQGSANGTLMINHIGYGEKGKKTRKAVIRNGYVKTIEDISLETMLKTRKHRNIAELGIGTNPWAKDTSNILECEKIFGTIHIGFGNNTMYGGSCRVPFHIDGVVERPTLIADNKTLIKNGKWMI
jgi:leucyl aminopeptidase (aminopeptidase T)